MKRLMFGVTAALLTSGASAACYYYYEGCDLTTTPYTSDYDCWGIWSHPGTSQNFWLSGNLSKPCAAFMIETTGDASTSATVDFKGYTMSLTRTPFNLNATAVGDNAYSMPPTYLTLKDGKLDGQGQSVTLTISNNRYSSAINGHILLDNMVVTNITTVNIGMNMASSDVTFRNSCLSANYIEHFSYSKNGEMDTTVTYENSTLTSLGNFLTDRVTQDPDKTSDYNHKLVFTGSKTLARAAGDFFLGFGRPYFQTEVTDGAKLVAGRGFYFGYSATTAHHSKARFDKATLTGSQNFVVGHAAGSQSVSCNETKLTLNQVFVGYNSDNNTMVATNCDFSAINYFRIGGTGTNTNAPKNNKLTISGQNTTFKSTFSSVPFLFYGANGLLTFDDVTLNYPDLEFVLRPLNSSSTVGSEWYDNEVVFQNGAQATIRHFIIGSWNVAKEMVNYERLKVLSDAKLSVYATLVGGNYNEVIVSNATLEARSENLLWLGHNGSDGAMGNNALRLQGDHPKLRSTVTDETKTTLVLLENNPIVEYALPESLSYSEVPLEAQNISGILSYSDPETDCIHFNFPNLAKLQESLVGTKDVELMRGTKVFRLVASTAEEESALISYVNSTLPNGCSLYRTGTWPSAGSLYLRVKGGAVAKPGAVLFIK